MTEKDILSKVITVEKEIQERLMLEKGKSMEWLEHVIKDSEETVCREERGLRESFESARTSSKVDAERRAAEILKEAEEEVERISGIDEVILNGIVMKHLALILPSDGLLGQAVSGTSNGK